MFDVLQLCDQRLLRRAVLAGVPFDGALVDHDRKCKSGMIFGLGHDELRGFVDGVAGAVPIDDHAIDAAADHIGNLAVDLRGVGRAIADVHVVVLAKPEHQVGVNLGSRSVVEQSVNIVFADISRSQVAIRLAGEAIRSAPCYWMFAR